MRSFSMVKRSNLDPKSWGLPWFFFASGLFASAIFVTLPAITNNAVQREGQTQARFAMNRKGNEVKAVEVVSTGATEYPEGELGKMVRLGERLVQQTDTHPLSKSFVGNVLQCTSCHLDAGRDPKAASFIGVAAAYPAYSPREQKVITLEDRILNCFIRSQNGTRPENGSIVPVAIASYITWLSRGTPIAMNPSMPLGPNHLEKLPPSAIPIDAARGEQLYEDRCAACHGDEGLGSDEGPPVWGDESFNDGAGMSKIPKMASWLKVAMPPDETDLSDAEAYDIAAYVNSHPRPKFQPKPTPK